MLSTYRGQKRTLGHLELELDMVVRYHIVGYGRGLRIKPRSSGRAVCALKQRAVSPAPLPHILKKNWLWGLNLGPQVCVATASLTELSLTIFSKKDLQIISDIPEISQTSLRWLSG